MKTRTRPLFASERLRHAAIALVLVLAMASVRFLYPVDMTIWLLQAKLIEKPLENEIVYVDLQPRGDSDAAIASSVNRQVLSSIQAFDHAEAELLAINVPLLRSNSPEIDEALRAELIRNRGRVVLTRDDGATNTSETRVMRSDAYFEAGLPIASNHLSEDILDYAWIIESPSQTGTQRLPALWSLLTETGKPSIQPIAPDYTFRNQDILRVDAQELMDGYTVGASIPTGSKVVIGSARNVRIPGKGIVPSSIIHILAAATHDKGRGAIVPWNIVVIAAFPILLICALGRLSSTRRRQAYVGLVSVVLVAIVATGLLGILAEFAHTIALLVIYGICRALARYKRRHLLIEPRSKLPNFVALRRDLGSDEPAPDIAVVVAKVARLDSVFTTLGPTEQERYLRQLADRLAFGQMGTTIYYDGGKYFAFGLKTAQFDDIEAHLRGLRAIATQSVEVGTRLFDVSMTIGVDQDPHRTVSNRLSSAIAAADRAREAYRPVFMITDFQSDGEDWDYSLQTRLEHALSHDRIEIALQPQYDLASGRIVGAESLARWFDQEQGQIPPERFIGQCERVGRLDELTERILSKTLDSLEAMKMSGGAPEVSINISAIQLADEGIADLIERQVVPRAIDPRGVTIELTETARIENFDVARRTIDRIKQLGLRFSIDDFGIETANLQTVYELPFDEIKIDRLFIGNLRQSTKARAITTSLVSLAREAGMISTAEGIEDNATLELVRELGCDRAQGYFLSRPLQPKDLIQLMNSRNEGGLDRRHLG